MEKKKKKAAGRDVKGRGGHRRFLPISASPPTAPLWPLPSQGQLSPLTSGWTIPLGGGGDSAGPRKPTTPAPPRPPPPIRPSLTPLQCPPPPALKGPRPTVNSGG